MKNLIKGLSTSLLLVTVSLTTVQAECACSGDGFVNTEKTPLNIRAGMSQTAKVIATASKGSALEILSEEANWYKVMLDDGKVGYASSEFIILYNSDESARLGWGCRVVNTEATSLNVREGMGKDTKVIGKVRQYAKIRILDEVGENGEWFRVQLNNGKMGYVNKEFISENGEC